MVVVVATSKEAVTKVVDVEETEKEKVVMEVMEETQVVQEELVV